MIKVKNLVPNIYYNKSRDFQAIGRVFEVIYNYAKTNTDLILNSYEDIKMLDLLAKTIGFNSKHNYNTEDLLTLCNTFITIIKNKGSIESIRMAITALLNAQHLEEVFDIDVVYKDDSKSDIKGLYQVNIYVPRELDDLILLEDLFEYILPAGYSYRFISTVLIPDKIYTNIGVQHDTNTILTQSNYMSEVGYVSEGVKNNISRPDMQTEDDTHFGITYTGVVFKPISILDND